MNTTACHKQECGEKCKYLLQISVLQTPTSKGQSADALKLLIFLLSCSFVIISSKGICRSRLLFCSRTSFSVVNPKDNVANLAIVKCRKDVPPLISRYVNQKHKNVTELNELVGVTQPNKGL